MNSKKIFSEWKFDPKKLDFSFYEDAKRHHFYPKIKSKKKFGMVLPPPNVTGILHIGHALNISVSDAVARFCQLRNCYVKWIPGTDHAGIATQAKFEKILAEKNRSIRDYPSREIAYKDIEQWAKQQQRTIISQAENLVPILDWKNSFFTLDKKVNKLVNHLFNELYQKKLLYQENRLINWDVGLKTAISDIEIIHKKQTSKLYYILYKLEGTNLSLPVATTRPETMFGDVCLFVNSSDERYKEFVGKRVINPANNQVIPILADKYVNKEFASGVMKCTPAHDPNDYKLAKKYHLTFVNIMNTDGTMNENALQFSGKDRLIVRNELVELLKKQGLLQKIEMIENSVGYSSRSNLLVEPMLSLQWFIKTKPLAKKVCALQKKARTAVKLVPPRFNKILQHWLGKMDDWCISRQLIWGHQLPVYYNITNQRIVVSEKEMNSRFYKRDPDVLDTWFSSALWPFVCLGYIPNKKNNFFPNSLLVTGSDIIFFWVARMMLMSAFYTRKNPFKKVLITGIVRDHLGRKMSKSLNNGIDPNALIDQYGVDALRMYLTVSTTPGEDLTYQEQHLQYCWNFLNKFWNSSRFIFQQTSTSGSFVKKFDCKKLSVFDRWILARLSETCKVVERNFANYNFTVVGKCIIDFFWNDFCNNYLEISKICLKNNFNVNNVKKILLYVLKYITLLLHPFCPIITENIYAKLPNAKKNILLENFVQPSRFKVPLLAKKIFEFILTLRQIRVNLLMQSREQLTVCLEKKYLKMLRLANCSQIICSLTDTILVDCSQIDKEKLSPFSSTFGVIYIKFTFPDQSRKNQLEKRLKICQFELERATKFLQNDGFVKHAPEVKIKQERDKVKKYRSEIDQLKKILN